MSALAIASTDFDVVEATIDLTEVEARALTETLRHDIAAVADNLTRAFYGRAWVALGYATYKEWIRAELGDALVGLGEAMRLDVVGALADAGVSGRGIAGLMGFKSDQTARRLLALARPDGVAGPRRGIDGKTYTAAPAVTAARPVLAIAGPRKQDTALDLLELAGPDGLTIIELQKKKRWTYSQASACLSRLNAKTEQYDGGRRRVVERLAERRGGYAVYVLPEYAGDREVLALGQRLPRSA